MGFRLAEGSQRRMRGLHPDLVAVIRLAIQVTEIDFSVTEGLRNLERQKQLVAAGKSKRVNSRHLTGHAVDLAAVVDGRVNWDWKYYEQIAKAMKQAANELGISIEWGGDWKTFKDGVHFQLPFDEYPV